MDDLEEKLKAVLLKERERFENPTLEQKLKELRLLHQESLSLNIRIQRLHKEVGELKDQETKGWDKQDEILSTFAV